MSMDTVSPLRQRMIEDSYRTGDRREDGLDSAAQLALCDFEEPRRRGIASDE